MFHLLGNDVEDDTIPPLLTREVVKNSGSSKKADVPPPSADPTKAKKKAKVSGNEGALKTKPNNKDVAAPLETPSKHYKKPLDRHSRSGKTDSAKKIKQSWGSDDKRELVDERDALADANEEVDADSVAAAAETSLEAQKKSLQDYFAELELQKAELANKRATRTVAPLDGEVIAKEQETYINPTQAKKVKSKVQKEKKFLDIQAKFSDDAHAAPERSHDSRKPTRGRGGKTNFSTRKPVPAAAGAKKPVAGAKKPVVDDKNFPSL